MAKQIAEMQDWEAIAAAQAMTIAMMKLEQENLTDCLYQAQEAEKQLVRPEHRDGYWCEDLCCSKCYDATFRIKHTTPPQRTWVGLTDEEILLISADCAASHQHTDIQFARAIESSLKEKNL